MTMRRVLDSFLSTRKVAEKGIQTYPNRRLASHWLVAAMVFQSILPSNGRPFAPMDIHAFSGGGKGRKMSLYLHKSSYNLVWPLYLSKSFWKLPCIFSVSSGSKGLFVFPKQSSLSPTRRFSHAPNWPLSLAKFVSSPMKKSPKGKMGVNFLGQFGRVLETFGIKIEKRNLVNKNWMFSFLMRNAC